MSELSALSDDEIARVYAAPDGAASWLRVNFVTSLDGSATRSGLSGGLSDTADHRVFDILRRLCDVVIVGAGTIRAEGYGALRLDEGQVAWRRENGLAAQPPLAVVSGRLELDPADAVFAEAPVRPIVITTERAPAERVRALGRVAEVLVCGELTVGARRMREALAELGLTRQHSEGGPHLFGSMIAEDAVDELCLTVSPQLVAGTGPRISASAAPEVPVPLSLAHVLREGSTLILRYTR